MGSQELLRATREGAEAALQIYAFYLDFGHFQNRNRLLALCQTTFYFPVRTFRLRKLRYYLVGVLHEVLLPVPVELALHVRCVRALVALQILLLFTISKTYSYTEAATVTLLLGLTEIFFHHFENPLYSKPVATVAHSNRYRGSRTWKAPPFALPARPVADADGGTPGGAPADEDDGRELQEADLGSAASSSFFTGGGVGAESTGGLSSSSFYNCPI